MTSSPWLRSKTPIAPPRAANPTWRTLLYAGTVTGAWAGLVSVAIYGIARLLGVPFQAEVRPDAGLTQIPWFVPLVTPFIAALIGALAATLVLGRRHARQVVLWAGGLVAVVSIAWPLLQPETVLWSTRAWLIVMHVVAWFLVVPQIARIVGDSEPRASEPRDLLTDAAR
ncbi:MAG: DUF6069 family protein [Candidatus Nanopelagicales bacterium]|nr:DUF6069 family protein [Candidatus Nanopelagicales bacterium]